MRASTWGLLFGASVAGCSSHASPAGVDGGGNSGGASEGKAASTRANSDTHIDTTPGASSDAGGSSRVVDAAVETTDAEVITGDGGAAADGFVVFGGSFDGGVYNLGPVDYAETEWHNACAPATKYPAAVQAVEGSLLAGLWGNIPDVAGYCDACIWVETAKGKSALLRVVTYGVTTPNSLDTSQSAYDILNDGEYPRSMTWWFAECPDTGPILYEFQSASSQWWTSLWVRNARVPLTSVEVESPNHPTWAPLTRGSDGSLTDSAGFGVGTFTIRSTGVNGQTVSDTFEWPDAGVADAFLTGAGNFD